MLSNSDVDSVSPMPWDRNALVEDVYLDMERDPKYQDDASAVDQSSTGNRSSVLDEGKSVETRARFVQNVEAMYHKDGRERERVVYRTVTPGAPPIPAKSILRNGMSKF